jgi:hypothetical protein
MSMINNSARHLFLVRGDEDDEKDWKAFTEVLGILQQARRYRPRSLRLG